MNKEELRKQLQAQLEKHLKEKPDSVTVYAAEREPGRQPWKKKPSLLDKAFSEALEDIKKETPRAPEADT